MTHVRRVRTMACVLVAITLMVSLSLLRGSAYAASVDNQRKIVRFRPTPCLPLVKCLNLATPEGMATALAQLPAESTVLHQLLFINALAVELSDNNILTALNSLLTNLYVQEVVDDLVTSVDPICPSTAIPPTESYRWGPRQIKVPEAHDLLSGLPGSTVTVAVLDTGIDWAHIDNPLGEFYQRGAGGYNALAGGGSYFDDHGHGTHMAGIIGANLNGLSAGIVGAAPQVRLAAVKVLDWTGSGYLSDVINGLQWVHNQNTGKSVTEQVRLVNMSFGFPSDNSALRDAIHSLWSGGVIMVASAGNRCPAGPPTDDGGGDGDCLGGGPAPTCPTELNAIMYPAAYGSETRVIAVGATDRHDHVAAYSLSGPQLLVVAPGGDWEIGAEDNGQILSTNKLGSYGRGHGTSQAAAHVTGAIALVLQLQPTYSFADVRNLLKKTTVELSDPKEWQGEGRIDVEQVMEELLP